MFDLLFNIFVKNFLFSVLEKSKQKMQTVTPKKTNSTFFPFAFVFKSFFSFQRCFSPPDFILRNLSKLNTDTLSQNYFNIFSNIVVIREKQIVFYYLLCLTFR